MAGRGARQAAGGLVPPSAGRRGGGGRHAFRGEGLLALFLVLAASAAELDDMITVPYTKTDATVLDSCWRPDSTLSVYYQYGCGCVTLEPLFAAGCAALPDGLVATLSVANYAKPLMAQVDGFSYGETRVVCVRCPGGDDEDFDQQEYEECRDALRDASSASFTLASMSHQARVSISAMNVQAMDFSSCFSGAGTMELSTSRGRVCVELPHTGLCPFLSPASVSKATLRMQLSYRQDVMFDYSVVEVSLELSSPTLQHLSARGEVLSEPCSLGRGDFAIIGSSSAGVSSSVERGRIRLCSADGALLSELSAGFVSITFGSDDDEITISAGLIDPHPVANTITLQISNGTFEQEITAPVTSLEQDFKRDCYVSVDWTLGGDFFYVYLTSFGASRLCKFSTRGEGLEVDHFSIDFLIRYGDIQMSQRYTARSLDIQKDIQTSLSCTNPTCNYIQDSAADAAGSVKAGSLSMEEFLAQRDAAIEVLHMEMSVRIGVYTTRGGSDEVPGLNAYFYYRKNSLHYSLWKDIVLSIGEGSLTMTFTWTSQPPETQADIRLSFLDTMVANEATSLSFEAESNGASPPDDYEEAAPGEVSLQTTINKPTTLSFQPTEEFARIEFEAQLSPATSVSYSCADSNVLDDLEAVEACRETLRRVSREKAHLRAQIRITEKDTDISILMLYTDTITIQDSGISIGLQLGLLAVVILAALIDVLVKVCRIKREEKRMRKHRRRNGVR